MTFGAWLLQQTGREGWLGTLAQAAAADPRFPRRGSVKEVYQRLNALEADSNMFAAMEDAESEWMSERDT